MHIREIRKDEYALLDDFLYEAIFVPEGAVPPPRSILLRPELRVYLDGFGSQPDDLCYVAEEDGRVTGAVWVRDMEDYGHIAPGVPSFAISLLPGARGRGTSTALMKHMLRALADRGYERCSLAVQKANYAVRMYRNVGFETVGENEEEYIMACTLSRLP